MGSSVISVCRLPVHCTCPKRRCLLGEFTELRRDRLKQLIALRMDGRLRNRFDASDVIQEAFLRLAEHGTGSQKPDAEWPPYLWLRRIVLWTLAELQRKHLGTQARDVRRELQLDQLFATGVSSLDLAERLLDSVTSPTQAVCRAERVLQVRKVLEQLDETDREILVLRHVEQLTRSETAELLGITVGAAAKRYFRTLARCRILFAQFESG